jgi:hypothetical protein
MTCHMLSHALASVAKTQNIAENENRSIMKPVNVGQIMADSHGMGQKVKVIAVPGEHRTGVLKGTLLGKLVWFFGAQVRHEARHAAQWRHPLDACWGKRVLRGHTHVHVEFPQHARIHARATRQADRNVSNNFTQHHFWVNEHHLGKFIKAFPLMAPIITNPTCLQTVGQLQQELQRMKATAPWTYTALVKCGFDSTAGIPRRSGSPAQSHRAWKDLRPRPLTPMPSIAGEESAGSYHPVADELRETGWNLTAYPGSVDWGRQFRVWQSVGSARFQIRAARWLLDEKILCAFNQMED